MFDLLQLHRRITRFDLVNLRRTILLDWSFLICLGVLAGLLEILEPFKRQFSLNDKSIQFTFAVHETVPPWALYILAGVLPLISLGLINAMSVRSFWDLHAASLGCCLSLMITGIATGALKLSTGRPRPDFIDRCQPEPGSADHPVFGMSNASICTQTNRHILFDGFKSYPSGHSSLSFSGLGFLALYLAGKLHIFHARGWGIKLFISFIPLIGAALVAISRTMDNRHHWHDVLAGSSLGLFIASLSYLQFFHPLASPNCHEALPPRSILSNRSRDSLVRDDDESIQLRHSGNPPAGHV